MATRPRTANGLGFTNDRVLQSVASLRVPLPRGGGRHPSDELSYLTDQRPSSPLPLPHIHADYQGQVGVYSIQDGTVLAGGLPPKQHKLVVAWIEIHQEDLMADWELAVTGRNPLPIRGLDQ